MDDEEINFINGADLIQKFIQLSHYVETQIEELVKNDMLDVLVDTNGIFYYKPTDKYVQSVKEKQELDLNLIKDELTFSQILKFHQKYNA